ncbi:MAG: TrkH family potassium uptake protein [Pseudomonadota bacterium]
MLDLRPIGYVLGLLLVVLGLSMLLPMAVGVVANSGQWATFAQSALLTGLSGLFLMLACASSRRQGLNLQETFLMTTSVWLVLPVFAALPFIFGPTQASYVDGLFEAMSGMTTTGSTVFTGLDDFPPGLNLWRGLMQWFGGIGIIVVAMVFLPELRIGGMQIFRSEGFDTMGKILPRAAEIASRISVIYLALTVLCGISYASLGMPTFDAVMHAMTTISTGGFSSHDASFNIYQGPMEYVAVFFMVLASLPFVRFVQLIAGSARPILRDTQIRAYLGIVLLVSLAVAAYRVSQGDAGWEAGFREALFNVTSILSGTGYSSADYQAWGGAVVAVFFFIGLIGGCAGSTSCSIKVFRYQLLFASISTQVRRLYAPHGVFEPRYQGRPVAEDAMNAVMAFFVLFFVSLGVIAVLLGLTGLDFTTAVSGAATALANVGPGLGPIIGPVVGDGQGFGALNDTAKWILIAAMLIGRLELVVVFVLFTARFWRG